MLGIIIVSLFACVYLNCKEPKESPKSLDIREMGVLCLFIYLSFILFSLYYNTRCSQAIHIHTSMLDWNKGTFKMKWFSFFWHMVTSKTIKCLSILHCCLILGQSLLFIVNYFLIHQLMYSTKFFFSTVSKINSNWQQDRCFLPSFSCILSTWSNNY